jgi:thiosulfate/3-mercaptopyruvate sulfurtransferase
MISTFYGTDLLASPAALFAALVIGLAFGLVLERAGFGSSRRLAGIFYFRDMTVLKVMFTAVVTAMLGLSLAVALGWIDLDTQVYLIPTIYGAQVVGGLIFGVGFVISGWCPGTAAVGTASGKLDGLVFLGGAVIGSIGFNETFGLVKPLYRWGEQAEPLFAFGLSPALFALLFTAAAIGALFFAEWVEKRAAGGGRYLRGPFLKAFSLSLAVFAAALFIFPQGPAATPELAANADSSVPGPVGAGATEAALLESIESGEDHFEPEELAERLLQGDRDLLVVDVRPAAEFEAFHVRGAVNVPLAELPASLAPYRNRRTIVLYSTGMTHPAQARDALARQGFGNVFLLTDGLKGFVDRCLKPVSLRDEPLPPEQADKVRAWRSFFLDEQP